MSREGFHLLLHCYSYRGAYCYVGIHTILKVYVRNNAEKHETSSARFASGMYISEILINPCKKLNPVFILYPRSE